MLGWPPPGATVLVGRREKGEGRREKEKREGSREREKGVGSN